MIAAYQRTGGFTT